MYVCIWNTKCGTFKDKTENEILFQAAERYSAQL